MEHPEHGGQGPGVVDRVLHLAPYGARIRARASRKVGTVVGYLLRAQGSIEYLAKFPGEGERLIPLHLAVPVSGPPATAVSKGGT